MRLQISLFIVFLLCGEVKAMETIEGIEPVVAGFFSPTNSNHNSKNPSRCSSPVMNSGSLTPIINAFSYEEKAEFKFFLLTKISLEKGLRQLGNEEISFEEFHTKYYSNLGINNENIKALEIGLEQRFKSRFDSIINGKRTEERDKICQPGGASQFYLQQYKESLERYFSS